MPRRVITILEIECLEENLLFFHIFPPRNIKNTPKVYIKLKTGPPKNFVCSNLNGILRGFPLVHPTSFTKNANKILDEAIGEVVR